MGGKPLRPSNVDLLTTGYKGRILTLVVLCTLTTHVGFFIIPPLLPAIISDLQITPTMAGVALTIMTGFSALFRNPGGIIGDQLSRKTAITIAILFLIIGFLALLVTHSYPVLLISVVLIGIGLGFYTPTAYAQISDHFKSNQGQAFGLNNAANNLGGVFSSILAISVISLGFWRLAFVPIIVSLLGLLILLHFWDKEAFVIRPVVFKFEEIAHRLIFDTWIRKLLIITAMFSFIFHGSMSFLPLFLTTDKAMSQTFAGIMYAVVFLIGVVATPFSGKLGDRIGHVNAIRGLLFTTIAGLFLVIFSTSISTTTLGIIVFSAGLTGFWPVMTSFMMSVFPEESKGSDYGTIGVIYSGVGSLGPTYVSFTAEVWDMRIAYIGLLMILFICVFLLGRRFGSIENGNGPPSKKDL